MLGTQNLWKNSTTQTLYNAVVVCSMRSLRLDALSGKEGISPKHKMGRLDKSAQKIGPKGWYLCPKH